MSALFTSKDLQWTSQPVVFHSNHGDNLQLSLDNTLATRVKSWYHAIACTNEPVSIGRMFKVTVMERNENLSFGGLAVGFTGENPNDSNFPKEKCLSLYNDDDMLIYWYGDIIKHEGKDLCQLDFRTHDLEVGQSLGILLTRDRHLHWFVDDKWRGVVYVDNYPIDKPVWGVSGVVAQCIKVRAEICRVSECNPSMKGQMIELGMITSLLNNTKIQSIGTAQSQRGTSLNSHDFRQLQQDHQLLKENVKRNNKEIRTISIQMQQMLQDFTRERATVSVEIHHLKQQVASLSAVEESWYVSPEEVSIREDQILGRGAWGYVAKGIFRGTAVAVKRVYPEILEQTTLDRIRREIRTMAHIRHPNLVLFIVAVVNEHTGPMIVTELLDISLRQAYQANRVRTNKRKIFRDISSALSYLHQQREPIIHRDVSTANVLLTPLPNETWLAKLSDFGSANLARDATTPGEGAILYTAPEAFPHHPSSPTPPPPQTTKIDVYSFGVVACEVVTQVFPESNKFAETIEGVSRKWPQIHPLVVSCVSRSPQDRPTMVTVLDQLQELNNEPVS